MRTAKRFRAVPSRRGLIRFAGLSLLAGLAKKAAALPRGKGGGGSGGGTPTTIRVTVGATNYDLALSTKTSEGQWASGSPYNIVQDWYDVPTSTPLKSALPGLYVKWRPDHSTSSQFPRSEIVLEMSAAMGPSENALAAYTVQLLDGVGSAIQMQLGTGDGGLVNSIACPSGMVMYQSWRLVSTVRPAIVSAATIAGMGASATYNPTGPTPDSFSVTAYAPLGGCGIDYTAGPGGRPEIGLFTEYSSQWLALSDSTSFTAMMRGAEAYSSLATLARDSSGQLFNMDNFPGWGPNGSGASNTWALDLSGDGAFPPNWDVSHIGQFTFVPALVTGDPYIIERAQSGINTTMCLLTNGNGMGLITGNQLRGVAWAFRDLCCACLNTPASGLPSTLLTQNYLLKKQQNNVQFMTDFYINGIFPETAIFNLLYVGNYFSGGVDGFMNWYLGQVLSWAVWAGFTNVQPLLDWHAVFALNVGNGTSGWGHTQPGIGPYTAGSYAGYYHGAFSHGDGTPCTSWTDAWDTNYACPTATFTGTITGGTTLTVSGVSGNLGVGPTPPSSLTLYGAGITNSGQEPLIIAGGPTTFTLDSSVSNVGPEAMLAQYNPGPSGPFTISSSLISYPFGTPDPEMLGPWNTSGSPPFTTITIDGTYTPLYAATLRGYIANGHSATLTSVLAGNPAGSDLQFMWNYTYGSRTPPTIPTVTVDMAYVSPFLNIGGTTYAAFGFYISQFEVTSGGLLEMADVNSSQTFINCGSNVMKVGASGGFYVITGSAGSIETSNSHTFNLASLAGMGLGPFTF